MNKTLALISLLRALASDLTERRIIAAALSSLIRKRRKLLQVLSSLKLFHFRIDKPKFLLWNSITKAFSGEKAIIHQPDIILSALKSTQAYKNSEQLIKTSSTSCFARGINYRNILHSLQEINPRRVFIFHHYDQRGYFPRLWLNVLFSIQREGWQVIVSTSNLNHQDSLELESIGILIARRLNVGICLGAYKDLSLLVSNNYIINLDIHSFVLCNDSTLPIFNKDKIIYQLRSFVDHHENSSKPTLASFTDSSERGYYHLQSYFLYANSLCVKSLFWQQFWLEFDIFQNKDNLINDGEIGLSQKAILNGFDLYAIYPIIKGLMSDSSMSNELKQLGFSKPGDVNQSLFAWKSLLDRGCPLIKKQVIFDLESTNDDIFSITALEKYLSLESREIFINDLSEIFISRNLESNQY